MAKLLVFQRIGSHKSLSIRSKTPINGQNKFKLIIYERIVTNADRIKALGTFFDLYYQHDELVKVTINQLPFKLYYFEVPLKNGTFTPPHLINIELNSLKSPITNQLSNYDEFKEALHQKLLKLKFPPQTSSKIKLAYETINSDIVSGNFATIHRHFDLDYISAFQCARLTGGFVNHGFTPENLLFALDTNNYKFYPILHRDNYCGTLSLDEFNTWTPYYYENVQLFKFEILELISNNKTISKRTLSILTERSDEFDSLITVFDKIDEKHSKIMVPKYRLFSYALFTDHKLRSNTDLIKITYNLK